MSYQALVCRATNVRPHPNADRLQLMTTQGFQVVVGLDVKEGDLGVMFVTDGKLSEDYCRENDLIRRKDPVTGANCGGMFDENRRVRSQKFRGERSDGYWAPLSSLAWTGADLSKLSAGDQFDTLNDKLICEKYFTPATLRAMKGGTAKTRKVNRYFAEHVDTPKLQFKIDSIPDDSIVYVTLKMHGTSSRFGQVLDETLLPQGRFAKLLRQKPKVAEEYKYLHGTRRVVLKDPASHQGFYGEDEGFRVTATKGFIGNLHKGEVIYGEIVGWTEGGVPIMPRHSTKELKDLKKIYGNEMLYKYGQPEGTCQFYIYRITHVTEDGAVIELPWSQVRARCHELGYRHVPDLAGPFVVTGDESRAKLLALAEQLSEGPDPTDASHIREGVVVRVEKPNGETVFLKYKSWHFSALEGHIKLQDDYVDTEEAS